MNNLEQVLRLGLADRYTVGRELGRGGMAVVYYAIDVKHGRGVAIKAFRPPTADPVAKSRFLQEIRTVATLSHPHILQLHDSGEVAGILYFVTPFVDGETLRDRLARGPMAAADAARIGAAIAGALDHAHRRGVVHRDVKPENILLQDEQPLLSDFGIAFPFHGPVLDTRLTGEGFRIGTPSYMSPEQIAGEDVDGRSDIYALGLVMYEMLAGRKPFEGRSPDATLAAQLAEHPTPLVGLRTGVPAGLSRAVERALVKDPARRWQHAAEFAVALESTVAVRRAPILTRNALIGLVVMAAGFLFWRFGPSSAEPAVIPVMMSDFEGPSQDSLLARTVGELVLLALTQSPAVSLLSPDDVRAVRHAADIPDSSATPLPIARQLAERAGAALVIGGSVIPQGGGYVVTLHAVKPADGSDVVRVLAHAEDVAGLVKATERAATNLRKALGERTRSMEAGQPLINIATPSFAAFRMYARALDRARDGDGTGSNALLREAVALDTGFSAAWAQMALNHLDARQLDSAAAAIKRALQHPERLVDATRYRLQADAAYTLDSDPAAAVERYDRYLEVVKRSSGGRNNRALYLTMLGRWDEARTEFLRAASENPLGPAAAPMLRLNAISAAVSLGRLDSARLEVDSLDGPFRRYGELLVTAAENGWHEAGMAADAIVRDSTAPAWLRMQAVVTRAAALSADGDPDAADRYLATASSAPGVTGRWYGQARVLLAMARGSRLPDVRGDTMPGALVMRGIVAGWNGDAATATRIAREVALLDESRRRRLGNGTIMLQAAALAGRGDWRAAAALLAVPAQAGELDAFALDRPSSDLMRWAAARAWLKAGDTASAARALAPLGENTRLPPNQLPLRGLTLVYARSFIVSQP